MPEYLCGKCGSTYKDHFKTTKSDGAFTQIVKKCRKCGSMVFYIAYNKPKPIPKHTDGDTNA